ncbi:MAG: UDP-N-acetylglucosamine--N-acetylmuramyl-(pentapeptide) pyrophosphoryl-undecaprenol N-acetylglucosamine transferase [Candidatus Gottesmanbacteria bacterium]|nr:UDP-N-acetylglucosamine--N-acetylmuramyl-(pentapeptide) pyrophosphoryl-undecaprenol N-acetylglucosamine transferase [Candidatus Gottesmanbacteria bacterium]
MTNKHTIVITGGHITPAIALIDALKVKNDSTVVFIGRKHAIEGSREPSFEYQLIKEKGIRFVSITTGRLQRQFTRHTIPSLLKIPIGCIQAYIYCFKEHPSLIVSFGGYVGLPVAVAGWLCRIPVITHEQTRVAGLANRIIARIAKRVCVTFPETVGHFPKGKAVYTGLPMRSALFTPPKKAPFSLDIQQYPLMYVTGGGTGAQSLNRLLFPILPALLREHSIVHQVGDTSLPEAQKIRAALPTEYKDRYVVQSYIPLPALSWVLSHTSLVLGRSGANTVMELAALGKVALLVPLPWSGGNEQQENAIWLASYGGAIVLNQNELTPRLFEKKIETVWANIRSLQLRADACASGIPRNGTERLLTEIEHIFPATA